VTLVRFAAVFVSAYSCIAAAQSYEVPAELWDRPRTAGAISGDEAVRGAVHAVLAAPESRLVIRHSPGQEPLLQAEELRSWLGSLAIDPRRIVLRSDLTAGAPLRLEVTP